MFTPQHKPYRAPTYICVECVVRCVDGICCGHSRRMQLLAAARASRLGDFLPEKRRRWMCRSDSDELFLGVRPSYLCLCFFFFFASLFYAIMYHLSDGVVARHQKTPATRTSCLHNPTLSRTYVLIHRADEYTRMLLDVNDASRSRTFSISPCITFALRIRSKFAVVFLLLYMALLF